MVHVWKPRATLTPLKNPKYCHICRKQGHEKYECFLNTRVIVPHGWENPIPVYYPAPILNQHYQLISYVSKPLGQVLIPTPFLPPKQLVYMHIYQPPMVRRYHQ